jgi:hypothetical protein
MVPSAGQKIPLVKKGFFRQVRELKIQRKNPGSALCLYIYTNHGSQKIKELGSDM